MKRSLVALAVGVLLTGGVSAILAPAAAADPPTGGQLSEAVRDCTQQISNGLYAERVGQARTIPVCATGNAVHWRSGMTIDCDGQRTPKCNESTDPYWQNETAYPQSDGKPLNAETLPFVVVPLPSSTWDHADANITGGTVVAVVYEGRVVYGVVGDKGPTGQIGEASYATAAALGINPSPSSGGVEGKVVDYIAFPGVRANPIENNADAVAKGEQAAADLIAGRRGCGTTRLDFPTYSELAPGATGEQVTAAQCLLRAAGENIGDGDPTGTLDETSVAAAKSFQTKTGLPATGTVDAHTWTALLSRGSTPQLSNGSTGEAVSRVQRATNAAVGAGLTVDGQFGTTTTAAVKQYQTSRGLTADGVVGSATWTAMQKGK
jgi:glycosyl hydrolase group 75 (putative chitosanase)/putative peptidoglycan binding protein